MTSRNKALNKPYWKRPTKQQPSYVREYAFDDEGAPVMEAGHYVTAHPDGTLEYDKAQQVHRDRPNRAMVRQYKAKMGLK
jgi:hypothetical protein